MSTALSSAVPGCWIYPTDERRSRSESREAGESGPLVAAIVFFSVVFFAVFLFFFFFAVVFFRKQTLEPRLRHTQHEAPTEPESRPHTDMSSGFASDRDDLLRWSGRITPELLASGKMQDPEVVRALLKIKRRVSQISAAEQQGRSGGGIPMGTASQARSEAAAVLQAEASNPDVIGPSATGLLIGSARRNAPVIRDDTLETCYQEQQRTCVVSEGYVQTARLQKKSKDPPKKRALDSSRPVSNDVFNYIYKTGDLAAAKGPQELRKYNQDLQHQLDVAYGKGAPRKGPVAGEAFNPYDRSNQCWPWKASTQNKQHWLQGRQDGSMSPFVPFAKQD